MAHRREYDIAFVGLKPGVHVFDYQITDKFFSNYGPQEFNNCHADIQLSLDKHSGFMQLKFDVGGSVDVVCDRCGNPIHQQLWDEFNLVVKLVDEPELMNEQEEDPDVFYLSRGESHLHVADWLFEFVNLSIPNQKVCNLSDEGASTCNQEVIAKLEKMQEEIKKENNPLWKGLEKFKDLDK
jgi:uncharacterized metal-binding protein YceD (DUF177 family)